MHTMPPLPGLLARYCLTGRRSSALELRQSESFAFSKTSAPTASGCELCRKGLSEVQEVIDDGRADRHRDWDHEFGGDVLLFTFVENMSD